MQTLLPQVSYLPSLSSSSLIATPKMAAAVVVIPSLLMNTSSTTTLRLKHRTPTLLSMAPASTTPPLQLESWLLTGQL